MPRISKSKVQYEVGGKTWIATFSHVHAKSRLTRSDELKHLLLGIARAARHGDIDAAIHRLVKAEELLDDNFVKETPVVATIHNRKSYIQHTTTCMLGYKDAIGLVRGEAHCSLSDTYNWRFGIRESLRHGPHDCLQSGDAHQELHSTGWNAETGNPNPLIGTTGCACDSTNSHHASHRSQ